MRSRRNRVRARPVALAAVGLAGILLFSFYFPIGAPRFSVFDRAWTGDDVLPQSAQERISGRSWADLDLRLIHSDDRLTLFLARNRPTGVICQITLDHPSEVLSEICSDPGQTPLGAVYGSGAGVDELGGFNYTIVVAPDGWERVAIASATCQIRDNVVIVRDAPTHAQVSLHRGVRSVVILPEREPRDPAGLGRLPSSVIDGTPHCVDLQRPE